jgi:hypothetical protein
VPGQGRDEIVNGIEKPYDRFGGRPEVQFIALRDRIAALPQNTVVRMYIVDLRSLARITIGSIIILTFTFRLAEAASRKKVYQITSRCRRFVARYSRADERCGPFWADA